jgi:predicted nucleic acid-binding protein
VLNASPIIYICKAGLADKLRELKSSFKLLTTREVYEEVYLKGIERGVSEADMLKELFEGGLIELGTSKGGSSKAKSLLESSAGIHTGEVSAILLALELEATAIMDDKRARRVAKILGVRLSGTPALIIEMVRRNIISKKDAKRAFKKIIEEGWYCSARVFSKILKAVEEA